MISPTCTGPGGGLWTKPCIVDFIVDPWDRRTIIDCDDKYTDVERRWSDIRIYLYEMKRNEMIRKEIKLNWFICVIFWCNNLVCSNIIMVMSNKSSQPKDVHCWTQAKGRHKCRSCAACTQRSNILV